MFSPLYKVFHGKRIMCGEKAYISNNKHHSFEVASLSSKHYTIERDDNSGIPSCNSMMVTIFHLYPLSMNEAVTTEAIEMSRYLFYSQCPNVHSMIPTTGKSTKVIKLKSSQSKLVMHYIFRCQSSLSKYCFSV